MVDLLQNLDLRVEQFFELFGLEAVELYDFDGNLFSWMVEGVPVCWLVAL